MARMDQPVVLDGGEMVETGVHAELVRRGGLCARVTVTVYEILRVERPWLGLRAWWLRVCRGDDYRA